VKRHALFLLIVAASAAACLKLATHARAAATRNMMLERIDDYRQTTWQWQSLMGVRLTPTHHTERRSTSSAYRAWVLKVWRRRAAQTRRLAAHPPHEGAWRCIQRYEAPWHAATGNGYYGGLQMDTGFQSRYGYDLLRRKGLAHRWSPTEQMWVAERALRAGRGYYPWPNTARICGLI